MASNENTRILPEIGGATVGTRLSGIYELDERIASGGMGEVYRGHNIETNDPVAIKIVLPEFARDPTILALFRKEASILFHLSHDAIVRYHVFTVDPGIGRPYMAMEFVNGVSLVDLMDGGPMALEDVRKLCIRLASGLATAHEAGVIHRDLSPDNVIVVGGKVDRAKIIDFGIARSANVGGETLLGGKFAGKYNYVSPEQLGLYGGDVTDRSDIYSLGLVLAAMLLGKPIDMSGSQVDVIDKRRKVPDLSAVDPSFRPLLEAMLQPDPADRPKSMNDVVARAARSKPADPNDMRTVIQQRPLTMPPTTQPPTTQPPASPPIVTQQPMASTQPPAAPPRPVDTWAIDASTPAGPIPRHSAGSDVPAQGNAPQRPAQAAAPAAPATVSESPFGPYVPPPEVPFTKGVAISPPAPSATIATPGVGGGSRPPRGNTGLIAAAVGVILVLAGGGLYFSGILGPSEQSSVESQGGDSGTGGGSGTETGGGATGGGGTEAGGGSVGGATTTGGGTEAGGGTGGGSTTTGGGTETGGGTGGGSTTTGGGSTTTGGGTETAPPVVIDKMAQIITWLKDYPGGACSFATPTSVSDKATDIEAFGSSVEPFEVMMQQFQEKFGIEPNISVRQLEPNQCIVADFLRTLSNSRGRPPQLTLAQTTIPSGGTLTGEIKTENGRHTDLILVDHKGVAYNLNDRLIEAGDGQTFSIKLGLGAADLARQDGVPQLVIAITSDKGIPAASFTGRLEASELFSKISEEMGKAPNANATAKYFRLGG
jgi:serine/threonine-protein kinase